MRRNVSPKQLQRSSRRRSREGCLTAASKRQVNRRDVFDHVSPRKRGTVLVPTDFTEAAQNALNYAKGMAKKLGANIVVLHVIQPSYAEGFVDAAQKKNIRAGARRDTIKKLDSITRPQSTTQVPITSMVRVGLTEFEILRTAQELGVQMIILGRQNRNPLSRLIFGSVTEDIIDAASCPVLVIKVPPRRPREVDRGSLSGEDRALAA